MGAIWLIGGTTESATLAIALQRAAIPFVVTATTEAARAMYPPEAVVEIGCLEAHHLPQFLDRHAIAAILDASHPFATEISRLAIAIARARHLPYLRFERPPTPADADPLIREFTDVPSLIASGWLDGKRVLLTVGYRLLPAFAPARDRAVLFARILPSPAALEAALAAGFTPDRLLAIRPPLSADFERALWQQWQIEGVVTKASGTAGGEAVKRAIAIERGTHLAILKRPPLAYPQQTASTHESVLFCQKHLSPPPS